MNTKGYLPHDVIKGIVFWVLSTCIVFATASGILRSWGTIGEEVASKCMLTALILALGSIAFLIINCVFGDYGQMLIGQSAPPAKVDPAFSECLKRSKVKGHSEDRSGVEDETIH
jgi:hypothetical protein